MSWSYCADVAQSTGFLSESDTKSFMKLLGKPPRVVHELVEARAWDVVEGGYAIHEFEQGLPEKSTARVRAWREKKRLQGVSGVSNATVAETLRNRPSRARVPVPEPVPVPVPDNASTHTTSAEGTPSPDAIANGQSDDPAMELAVGMHTLLGHPLSAVDVLACQAAINQYAYMDASALVGRALDHIQHCQGQKPPLPIPRTIAGFSETWRSQNDWLADHGAPKAWRPSSVGNAMTSIGETLPHVTPKRASR